MFPYTLPNTEVPRDLWLPKWNPVFEGSEGAIALPGTTKAQIYQNFQVIDGVVVSEGAIVLEGSFSVRQIATSIYKDETISLNNIRIHARPEQRATFDFKLNDLGSEAAFKQSIVDLCEGGEQARLELALAQAKLALAEAQVRRLER